MKAKQGSQTELSSERRKATRKRLSLSAIVVCLLVISAVIVIPRFNFEPTVAPSANIQTSTPTDPAPLDAAPAVGPQTAPVTIIEYGDFGCSTCWYWYKQGVLEQLRAKYGDQLRFVWRDFPVITLLSPKAAEAGQCAHEQGKFWEFHDLVYEHEGAIEASDLKSYAAEIGLDMGQFNECVTSHRYRDRVNAEQTEAFGRGFNGTPAFLINNQPLIGPGSLSVFESLIDPLLASKK